MRSTRFIRYILPALCGVSIVAPISAFAQSATTFTLTIAPSEDTSDYLSLLPVVMTMQLKNETNTTQTVGYRGFGGEDYHDLSVLPPRYRFVVQAPDGAERTFYLADYVNWNSHFASSHITHSLGPGETVTLDYLLACGFHDVPAKNASLRELDRLKGPVFPATGEYSVRLTLVRLGIESNLIRITARSPEAPADILAHAILASSEYARLFLAVPVPGTSAEPTRLRSPATADSATTPPYALCLEILDRCPGSAYAPYARLYLATWLAQQSTPSTTTGRASVPDVAKRTEAVALLRQCAEAPNLPRRYREAALATLQNTAKGLTRFLRDEVNKAVVWTPVERVLGVASVDLGRMRARDVYLHAFQIGRNTHLRIHGEKALERHFTPDQIQRLVEFVLSRSDIIQAIEGTALSKELHEHAYWARQELCKIPWRDPSTAQSRLRLGVVIGH